MKILALDTETNIAIKQDLYIISIDDGTGPRIVYNRSEHGPNVPLDIINEISSADLIIMHGSLFDIPLLQKAGCTLKRIWDTMLAERVLNGGNQEHWVGLADLTYKYAGVTLDKTLQVSDWTQAVSEEQLEYSKNDVKYLKTVYENQFEFIQKNGLLAVLELRQILFKEWAIDLYNGLPLDHQFIKEFKPIVWAEYIKARLTLLNKLPVRFFIPSNVPKKSYVEIIDNLENHSIILPEKSAALKKQTLVQLREDFDYELLKSYFMNNPTSEMLIDIGASHFVNKVLKHFNVDLPSTGKQEMLDYLAEHSDGELAEILGIVLHARMCQKIYGTYLDGKVTEQIAEDGSIRTKLEMTVTGRITLKPINNIPAPDDNKTEFQNKLSHMFIPTAGYKRWVGDYSSLEDVVAGIFYRDSYKLETLHKKFDPYLLLAARLFKEFEYTSPDQTKELKSKYKSLRQAVKGAALAKNFSAGKDKFHSMLTRACEKQGIVFKLTPEEADYEYKQLYPDISAAHARLGYLVGGIVADNLEVEDEKEAHYLNVSTFPRGGGLTKEQVIAASVRERILKATGLVVGSNSVFGQRRTYDAHKCYTGVTPRYAKVGVTQLSNHPVQASAAEAKDLAVILVKKFYPSVLVPGTIHDSLICDVPENGIVDDCGTISLEEVAEGLNYLMKLAFWVVFNSPVGVDGDYVERGLK